MQLQGLSNQFRGQSDSVGIQNMSRTVFNGCGPSTGRPGLRQWAIVILVAGLSACSTSWNGLKPAGANAAEARQVAAADNTVQAAPMSPAASKFGPTAVGQKAAQLRTDFEKLKTNTQTRGQQLETIRGQTVANVNSYHSRVGAIRSRLQMGSTPGNPELLAEWSQAQTQLT